MARVNVSKRSSTTTPKSLSAYRKTSRAPAPIAPRTWGSTTVRNTAAGPRPSRRALSSSDGDSAANRAPTGNSTYGVVNSVSTSHAPQNPSGRVASTPIRSSGLSSRPPGDSAAVNASAPTKDGNTSGNAASAAQRRRNGRSVRVVTQARAVPTIDVDTAVAAARPSVLRSGTRVALDVYRSASASSPVAVRHARYTSGVANSAPMTAQTTASVAGARVRPGLAVEATLVDHRGRRLEPAPQLVEIDARLADLVERRQGGVGDGGPRQRILEGLVAGERLRRVRQQELDQFLGVVAEVGALDDRRRGHEQRRAVVAVGEVVVLDGEIRVLLQGAERVVVVDQTHRHLASSDGLDDGGVVVEGRRVTGGPPLEPGPGVVVAELVAQHGDEVLERAVGGGQRHLPLVLRRREVEHRGGQIGRVDQVGVVDQRAHP